MNAPGEALGVRGLVLGFDRAEVLKGVDFSVASRGVTALIGPSGCGKSTLLRCFNRMNDHLAGFWHRGEVSVTGRDVYDPTWSLEALRFQVGMVFQKPNPFPLSIKENVLFGPRLAGVTNAATLHSILSRSLQRANLWDETKDRLDASALAFSGGKKSLAKNGASTA